MFFVFVMVEYVHIISLESISGDFIDNWKGLPTTNVGGIVDPVAGGQPGQLGRRKNRGE